MTDELTAKNATVSLSDERALEIERLDEANLVDEAESDTTIVPQAYNITSYGADWDVEGIVRRLNSDRILRPDFQREYVWNLKEASRFIESLLLGLPVPGVILAKEPDANKFSILDGQQRLKTLKFFYGGYFDPRPDDSRQRVFRLQGVQEPFEGKQFGDLGEQDQLRLSESIIHATIVKQDFPEDDDSSIYHIFERLNSGGRRLFPQEIRVAIYFGDFINHLRQLNENREWREIFGKRNRRLKDQELIARFLALYEDAENYRRPMTEFLNGFTARNRYASEERLTEFQERFEETISQVRKAIGRRAFRPQNAINAAVFDSVMVAVARRLGQGPEPGDAALKEAYETLLHDDKYIDATSRATADEAAVAVRLKQATDFIGAS